MNKKNLIVWSLYDFANSLVMIAFFLYFSQWLVIDHGVSDFWFNFTFVASSVLLLLSGPIAAAIVDKTKVKLPGLRATTIVSAIFYLITGLIAVKFPHHIVMSMVTFTIAAYFYLLSFNYYNPLINDIAPPGKQGMTSGWGMFGNYLGEITAILISYPFAEGYLHFYGEPGRAQPLIPATIVFFLLTLPMLIWFKEKSTRQPAEIKIIKEYKSAVRSFIDLCKNPSIGLFFLAYFFFNDAVLTASNNFPIYTEKVFHASDAVKSYLLLGILVTSVIGAPISGWLADKVGTRKAMLFVLGGWILMFPLMATATNIWVFGAVAIIMGIWFGAIWTVTRAFLAERVPENKLNLTFSYYTVMERFATFVGPLSWGLIVTLTPPGHNSLNYRLAALFMGVFIVLGFLVARKIPKQAIPSPA